MKLKTVIENMQTLHRLKNNMKAHLIPSKGTDAVTVLVLTKLGSRYEPDHLWGASHFIEHLMFKGTEKRPSTIEISRTLERYGADFNAYTGKERTGYYVKIQKDHADVAVDLLHDMIFHSLYDNEEMEREKGVIIEEIKMYEENPMIHLGDLMEDGLYRGSRLGKNIAGTAESMRAMKREDVIEFRDRHYKPENMVVIMAGAVPENALQMLNSTFGQIESAETEIGFENHTWQFNEDGTPHVELQEKDIEQIQLGLAFPGYGKHDSKKYASRLMAGILGGGMSSRLFIEIRERRGLCYSIRAGSDNYTDAGDLSVSAGLDRARLEEATVAIIDELKKIKEHGVTAEELDYIKENIAGRLKLGLEDSSRLAEFYGNQELFFGETITPDELVEKYNAVTLQEVHEVAKEMIDFSKLSIGIIGPYKDTEDVLKAFPVLK